MKKIFESMEPSIISFDEISFSGLKVYYLNAKTISDCAKKISIHYSSGEWQTI